jgi:hypothetical protein
MLINRVIARCPKCRGEVLPSGICPLCDDVAASIERLRPMVRHRRARKPAVPTENLPLSGQDAALPVGDR